MVYDMLEIPFISIDSPSRFEQYFNNLISLDKYMIKNFRLVYETGASYYFYNFGNRHIPGKEVFLLN